MLVDCFHESDINDGWLWCVQLSNCMVSRVPLAVRTMSTSSAISSIRMNADVMFSRSDNRLRRIPPAEADAEHYARLHAGKHTGHT